MRPTEILTLLIVAALTALCVALDAPAHGAGSWAFAGLTLAAGLALVLWPRRRSTGEVPRPPSTLDLLRAGLVLGFTGFGGGLAVLTQVEHRLVGREGWTDAQGFAEATALGQSLPGAISTNTLGFIGWRLARLRGALALEGGFILPSALMMIVFALLYSRVRQLTVVAGLFHLLNPAVAGLVGAMALRMAAQVKRTPQGTAAGLGGLLRDPWSLLVALGAAVSVGVFRIGVPEVVIVAGLLGLGRHHLRARHGALALVPLAPLLTSLGILVAAPPATRVAALTELQKLGALTSVFLRAGTLTFGGGYVIVPMLEAELVRGLHWLTPQAFVDAMTLGQITPGPVLITSTFVGHTLAGLPGALLATLAVFLPAFVLVVLVSVSLDRFRRSPGVQAFLDGLQPAVVGLMAAATATLVRNGVHDALAAVVALAAFLLLWRLRVNPLWVVLGAGALGAVQALVAHG
jgi:chromate transporter